MKNMQERQAEHIQQSTALENALIAHQRAHAKEIREYEEEVEKYRVQGMQGHEREKEYQTTLFEISKQRALLEQECLNKEKDSIIKWELAENAHKTEVEAYENRINEYKYEEKKF